MKLIYYRHSVNSIPVKLNKCKMDFAEITVVLKGQMQYVINGKKHVLRSNDIIYIPQGFIRERLNSDSLLNYASFNFIAGNDKETETIVYANAVNNVVKNIIATCDSVREITSSRSDERLLLLLQCLRQQLATQNKNAEIHPLVLKIKQYVRTNLDKKITLADISAYTFFSAVHCENVFRQETNSSIIDYAIDQKMKEAQYLLSTEATNIKHIAESVGFDNYNYFSRLFKKRTGLTPTEYKKRRHGD